LVELCQCCTQCLSSVLDGAHVSFGPIELRIDSAGHCEPCGCGTFFSERPLGGAEAVGQLLARRVLIRKRALEAFDRTEFTFAEKCHGSVLANFIHNNVRWCDSPDKIPKAALKLSHVMTDIQRQQSLRHQSPDIWLTTRMNSINSD